MTETKAAYIISVKAEKETFIREDGTAYTRSDIFVKLFVTLRDKMLRTLKGPKLSVYLCIALHCGEDMTAWPAISTIVEETGYSDQAVKKALQELQQMGLVDVAPRFNESGAQTSNRYLIKGYVSMGDGGAQLVSPPQVCPTYPPQGYEIYPSQGYEIPPKEEPLEEEPSEDMADADAPPPIPSPGEKFGRTEKDAVRKDAETYFSQVTGLAITEGMTARSRGQLWYGPLREVCALAQWDYRRVHELIDAACARLRKVDYTICDPNSIIKTVRALAAEPTTPQAPKQVATTNWQRMG